jgi:hypothetical protein
VRKLPKDVPKHCEFLSAARILTFHYTLIRKTQLDLDLTGFRSHAFMAPSRSPPRATCRCEAGLLPSQVDRGTVRSEWQIESRSHRRGRLRKQFQYRSPTLSVSWATGPCMAPLTRGGDIASETPLALTACIIRLHHTLASYACIIRLHHTLARAQHPCYYTRCSLNG